MKILEKLSASHSNQNAYREIVSVEEDGREIPIICGHGGSMWLCRQCKDEVLLKQELLAALEMAAVRLESGNEVDQACARHCRAVFAKAEGR